MPAFSRQRAVTPRVLDLAANHAGPIRFLLTDVVMASVGGRDLAEQVLALRPELKVLFMSGYTDGAVVRHGVLEAGTAFVRNPFTVAAPARPIRAVLDGEPAPAPNPGALSGS